MNTDWFQLIRLYSQSNRSTQRRLRTEHRSERAPVSDAWLARTLRIATSKMTSDPATNGPGALELDLLALVAPAALVQRLLLEAALNALKHSAIAATLGRFADVLLHRDGVRLGNVLRAVLQSGASNRALWSAPAAADSMARFVPRLFDAALWTAPALPSLDSAVVDWLDDSLRLPPAAPSPSSPLPLSWSEFVADVAVPIVADVSAIGSGAVDVVFAVLLRDAPLADVAVDVLSLLLCVVGSTLPEARAARSVVEVERRVRLFAELLAVDGVRQQARLDNLPSEARMRCQGRATPHPHDADLGAHLDDDQRCLLAALFSGSRDCEPRWRNDLFAANAASSVLDSLCATDLQRLDELDATALPTALLQWLARHDRDDDALLRLTYVLNCWLHSEHFELTAARHMVLAVARFPAARRGRYECLTQLTLAMAHRLRAAPTAVGELGRDAALRGALDDTLWSTLQAAVR